MADETTGLTDAEQFRIDVADADDETFDRWMNQEIEKASTLKARRQREAWEQEQVRLAEQDTADQLAAEALGESTTPDFASMDDETFFAETQKWK